MTELKTWQEVVKERLVEQDALRMCEDGHRYEVQSRADRFIDGQDSTVAEFVILCLACGECRTVRSS